MNDKADIIEDLTMVTPRDEYWWVQPAVWGLVLLVVAAAVAWRLYRRKKRGESHTPSIPAHVAALESLAAIHPLIAEGRFREFIIEVSRLLRVYIEARFALRAPHLSTEEFLYEAEQNEALQKGHQEILAHFLFQCDLVKFALGGTDLEQVENLYRTTEQFIDQTALRLPASGSQRATK